MNDNRIIIRLKFDRAMVLTASPKGAFVFDQSLIEGGQLSKVVSERLRDFAAKKKSDVIVILPPRQVIFKYFAFPTKNIDELRRMVDLQAGRGLPFSAQEIVYQFAQAGKDAQGLTRVVVAIARQSMVKECLDIVSAAGLNPSRCALNAFGVVAWHARRFPGNADKWVLIMDADNDGVEFCFCKNKQLLFARAIPLSKGSDDIGLQMELTLQAFHDTYPEASLSKAVLTGNQDRWVLLKEMLAQKAQIPCQEVPVEAPLGNDPSNNAFSQGSNCALLGMASANDPGLDLMPSSFRQSKDSRNESLAIMRMFVAMVFCAGAVIFMLHQRLERQLDALGMIRQKIDQSKKDYEHARRNLRLYELLVKDRSEKILITELFKEIYQTLPESVVLSNVQYSDGNLMVFGQTRESADVGAFQKALMNSALFRDVTLAYAHRPQRLAMEYTEFKIICRVRASQGGH